MQYHAATPAARVFQSRRAARALTGLALILSFSGSAPSLAHGQTSADDDETERRRERPTAARLGLEFRTSGVFDSNIDHDEADLDSYGAAMAARAYFRTRRLDLQYQAGVDRFSQTRLWDRATHRVRAEVRQRITSRWRANALAELSVGHSSDDRELVGTQYTLAPELEHRFDQAHRAYVYGRYRLRRFGDDTLRNDDTWQGGGEFRRDAGGRQSWSAGYRYEAVDASIARNSYQRHAYVVDYRVNTTPRDELLLGLTYRPRRYPYRVLQLPAGEALRRDARWTPRVGWARTLSDSVRLEAAYTFDHQNSNEQRKDFRAHRIALGIGWLVQ